MNIFTPDKEYRIEIRQFIESELKKKFDKGVYSNKEHILEVLRFIYELHYSKICDIIRGVNSRNIISFLLYQIEIIENSETKHEQIQNVVFHKETIFYLLDLFVEKKNVEFDEILYFHENELFHKLWIHAEKCIEYALAGNHVNMIGSKSNYIELFPSDSNLFLVQSEFDDFNKLFAEFQNDIKRNISLRAKYFKDVELKDEIIELVKDDENTGFEKCFGLKYLEFEYLFLDMLINIGEIERPNKIPCFSVNDILNISNQIDLPVEKLKVLISGISLRKQNFEVKNREIWNYVQQERARKRPLIELSFNGNKYLLFSPKMLGARIGGLAEDLVLSPQNRIPLEWNNTGINKKFSNLNTKIGEWFETLTKDKLAEVGVWGFKPSGKLKISNISTIALDKGIGPADFIGYSSLLESVVVCECKLLDCVFDSKGIRSELGKFVNNKKNYFQKFQEKIDWIKCNFESVKRAVEWQSKIVIPNKCNSIVYCFVTYYPTITEYIYDEIPIMTLAEFLDLLTNGSKDWPFKFGKLEIR
ncbi:MAG: hypothetical protein ACEPOZ_02690 [Marinifilaceae bacterium]